MSYLSFYDWVQYGWIAGILSIKSISLIHVEMFKFELFSSLNIQYQLDSF